jgi:hypothetical protein
VRLPRQQRPEIVPPTADHVLAVHEVLPRRYRLPLLVLDATGMRLGELERVTWALHLAGVPWARIGEHVGQRNLAVTANTYSRVLTDEAELDYTELLGP